MTEEKPIVTFDLSKVFNRHFVYHKDIEPSEWQHLNLCKNGIEKIFREKERIIMESLEKMFGETTEKEIRVWIVDGRMRAPSISKPLLLKCKRNPNFMLYILVHEIAHRYLDAGVRWKDRKSDWLDPGVKLEALCHFAAEQALGSDFTAQLYNELARMKGYGESEDFIRENKEKIREFLRGRKAET